jgi:hypothetical protein
MSEAPPDQSFVQISDPVTMMAGFRLAGLPIAVKSLVWAG